MLVLGCTQLSDVDVSRGRSMIDAARAPHDTGHALSARDKDLIDMESMLEWLLGSCRSTEHSKQLRDFPAALLESMIDATIAFKGRERAHLQEHWHVQPFIIAQSRMLE